MESVQFTTADGTTLAGDIDHPPDGTPVRGGVVLCHPHPLYGGNRHHPLISTLFDALPTAGFAAIRFDFRADHDHGVAEQLDVIAALDILTQRLAGHVDAPLSVAGYSFGAIVALNTADDRISRIAAVAPPLSAMTAAVPEVPTLVLTPRHDQYSPPDTAQPIVAVWPHAIFEVVESSDHFLAGVTRGIAERITAWLSA